MTTMPYHNLRDEGGLGAMTQKPHFLELGAAVGSVLGWGR